MHLNRPEYPIAVALEAVRDEAENTDCIESESQKWEHVYQASVTA